MAGAPRPAFPTMLDLPAWLPLRGWQALRALVLLATLGLVVACFTHPAIALQIAWGLVVPLLPLLFLCLPGLWRNLCPLATSNQLPRVFGFSRGLALPPALRRQAVLAGLVLLFLGVGLRRVLFDHEAIAFAALVGGALLAAFVGGLVFKGKSGWCGSICPLLPVQRLYGQAPLVLVPNTHCRPCVGCTHNCYDFNPKVAWLADLYDDDAALGQDRRLVAGVVPALVLAYSTAPAAAGAGELLLRQGLFCLVGIGAAWLAESLLRLGAARTTALFGAAALNLYYAFAAPAPFRTVSGWLRQDWPVDGLAWALRGAVFLLSLWWLRRSFANEPLFLAQSFAAAPRTRVDPDLLGGAGDGAPTVVLDPGGKQLVAKAGASLLEVLETGDCGIQAGCRMGACGADPVAVLEGGEALSPCSERERDTLQRLGHGEGVRLACSARVSGRVRVSLDPGDAPAVAAGPAIVVPADLRRIVIIGNGIAGVTAADVIRRHWREGELHLVAAERHPFYNRMGITQLITGRSALEGLVLMPARWYAERAVTTWLNTRVRRIDAAARRVELGTGETLDYDRLLVTAGSEAFVPPLAGWPRPGAFVLRDAEDAMAIREYVQAHDVRHAVVAGGGLLGLEAAYALLRLGLRVRVLDRSPQLLARQLDARASAILQAYLEGLGLQLGFRQEVAALEGEPALRSVRLKDGGDLEAQLLVVAAGIVPATGLAAAAGAETGRGILVDDGMRTSLPGVFAAGDAAEWRGQPGAVPGLWPVAVEQGRVAALNALGADAAYVPRPQPVALKVAGVDLTSIGEFQPREGDEVLVAEDGPRYRKLVLREGRAVGALLLGHPELADALTTAVTRGQERGQVHFPLP